MKVFGPSCVSTIRSPCSAVNGFDCEHEGEKAKSRRTHEGRKCVCVRVCLSVYVAISLNG